MIKTEYGSLPVDWMHAKDESGDGPWYQLRELQIKNWNDHEKQGH